MSYLQRARLARTGATLSLICALLIGVTRPPIIDGHLLIGVMLTWAGVWLAFVSRRNYDKI